MNDSIKTLTTNLVYRRFDDPIKVFGLELPPWVWGAVLSVVLVVAFFYVGWMYLKDSRSVGPWWATFLGLLRSCVYILLALVFLLPAKRTWEDTTERSKVLLLVDGSLSVTETIDDLPVEGKGFAGLPTRQEKVLQLLEKGNLAFIKELMDKNPVTLHRFGSRIDDFFYVCTDGHVWSREDLEAREKELDPTKKQPATRLNVTSGLLNAWLMPNRKDVELFGRLDQLSAGLDQIQGDLKLEPRTLDLLRQYSPKEINNGVSLDSEEKQQIKERMAADKERIKKLLDYNVKIIDAGVFSSTNVPDTTLTLLNKEINKMVQGIIVITDGRNTTPATTQTLLTLEQRSKAHKIPIFVVGVGSERPQVRVDVADVRAPKTIRPEDQFKLVVEVVGEGLAGMPAKITLDVTCVNKKADGKEELEDIRILEFNPKAPKDKKKQEISLGKTITLQPIEPVKFDKSTPPRATAEFQIDAASLARGANVDLSTGPYRGMKWEIAETTGGEGRAGTEIRFVARIPRDKAELFTDPEHVSQKVGLQVLRKPMQVLLFASSASREFQFLRTLLLREMDNDKALLSIYLQPPPGAEPREGIVHGLSNPKRQLANFPDKFDRPNLDEDAKLMDLASYDVIVCFDPDWKQLTDEQLANVLKWADRGGGLVLIGGPLNTVELARPGAYKEKLKPILDLYPVVLRDVRIIQGDRPLDKPWPLQFTGATPEMEFLRLSDEVEKGTAPFLSDWQQFWGIDKANPDRVLFKHGIFDYYPVEQEKAGNIVVARYTDPQSKDKTGQQMPYIVVTPEGTGRRVIWLGSGELWRLRQYKEMFHERFWTKLIRYAGASNQGQSTKRITLYAGRTFKANRPIPIDAKIFGKEGKPLDAKAQAPQVTIKPPPGVNPREVPTDVVMKLKPGSTEYYAASFQIRSPGTYDLEVLVPETKDVATQRFTVEPSNPELDNTRPDFDLMYRLASEADQVLPRMTEKNRQELRRSLVRSQGGEAAGAVKADKPGRESGDEKLRLYFDLDNAHLIPNCMISDKTISRSKGPVADWLWDDGWVLWTPADTTKQPIKLSYVLVIGVGLLSVEWLTRKLLRLA